MEQTAGGGYEAVSRRRIWSREQKEDTEKRARGGSGAESMRRI
jgi:hypothetical protein